MHKSPTGGQPLKRGQNLCSHSVFYSEIPLYIYSHSNCNIALEASSSYRRYSTIDISVVSVVKVGIVKYSYTHFHHGFALVPSPSAILDLPLSPQGQL